MKEILESVVRMESAENDIMEAMKSLASLNIRQAPEELIRKIRYVTSLLLDSAHSRISFERYEIRKVLETQRGSTEHIVS